VRRPQRLLLDPVRTLEESEGVVVSADVDVQDCEVVQALGDDWVAGSVRAFVDPQGALHDRSGSSEVAPSPKQGAEALQRVSDLRVVGAWGPILDLERTLQRRIAVSKSPTWSSSAVSRLRITCSKEDVARRRYPIPKKCGLEHKRARGGLLRHGIGTSGLC